MSHARALLILLALGLASLALAVWVGSVSLGAAEFWQAWWQPDTLNYRILTELRLPRALAAFVIGAMLALAGCGMQILLRNPLADPYVLGVSGGAGTAALAAMLLGIGLAGIQVVAFAGALFAMLLVFGLGKGRGEWHPTRLLLTGVILAAGWGALIGFLLIVSEAAQVHGMLFWLMGDLGQARLSPWHGLILLLCLAVFWSQARALNLLSRGQGVAAALGVSVTGLQRILFVLGSLLTAVAVSTAGSIGFVGLVVPHMVRLWISADHRILVPASVLLGGSLLTLADTLARSLLAPQQLPVGILTAVLGVPLFLYLLYRRAGLQ